jgi:RecA-family ATPase
LEKESKKMLFNKYKRTSTLKAKYRNEPYDRFLIEDLIETNSLNLLVAPSFTGKTYVAMDICRAIINGSDFLNKDCENGSVIYFDNEMKEKYFYKRMEKINFQDDNDNFIYYNNVFPDVSNESEKQFFIEKMKEFVDDEGANLIVVDSLNSSSNGLDENSNKDMREFMDFLNQVSAICTVLVVHHTSKYNNPKCLTREDIRGASCIFNICDNVFVIDSDDDVKTFKSLKSRNAEKLPKPIPFKFQNCGDELVLITTEPKVKAEKPSKEQVLELFKDNTNQRDLFKHFRDNGLVFQDKWMVNLLANTFEIKTDRGPKNSLIYSLKS